MHSYYKFGMSLGDTILVKYSICITNYNTKDTICESMESILGQLDSDFEVIVCDNCSDDGSREVLEEYYRKGRIKLVVKKSSRGKGRRISYENSRGDYIISGIDTDDILKPTIKDLLRMYHDQHEGYALSFATVHIIPRQLVEAIGGWRDLQYYEDVDFVKRIESLSKLHYFTDPSIIIEQRGNAKVKRGPLHRLKERYSAYQCGFKVGHNILEDAMRTSQYKPIEFLIALFALAACKIRREKRFEYNC